MIPNIAFAIARLGPDRWELACDWVGCWFVVDRVTRRPVSFLYIGREGAEAELERIRETGENDLQRMFRRMAEANA